MDQLDIRTLQNTSPGNDESSGLDIRSLENPTNFQITGATGDSNLYRYEPSKYDIGGIYPHELSNLEDIRAQNQGVFDALGRSTANLIGKTGINVAGGIAGSIYGIGSAIANGDITKIWDNSLTSSLDAASEAVGDYFRVYKSAGYDEKTLLGRMFLHPVQFIDEFMDTLSFTTGAIVTEMITAGLASGFVVPRAMKYLRNIDKASKASDVAASMARSNAGILSRLGDAGTLSRQLATGAAWEASVEARHGAMELRSKMELDWLEEAKKTNPFISLEDMPVEVRNDIADRVANAGLFTFLTNMALVGGSNLVQFPKIFGASYNTNKRAISNITGRVVSDVDGKFIDTALPVSRAERIRRNIFTAAKNPFMEGLVEEGGQGVISGTALSYFDRKNDIDGEDNVARFLYDFGKSLKDTYTTGEGWYEIGMGMLIGSLGSPGRGVLSIFGKDNKLGRAGFNEDGSRREFWTGGIAGAFQERSEEDARIAKLVEELNNQPSLMEAMKSHYDFLVRTNSYQKDMDAAAEKGDIYTYENMRDDMLFSFINTRMNAGLGSTLEYLIEDINSISAEDLYKEFRGEEALNNATQEEINDFKRKQVNTLTNKIKEVRDATKIVDNALQNINEDLRNELIYNAASAKFIDIREELINQDLLELSGGAISHANLAGVQDITLEEYKRSLRDEQKELDKESPRYSEIDGVLKFIDGLNKKEKQLSANELEILRNFAVTNPVEFGTNVDSVIDLLIDSKKLRARRQNFINNYNLLFSKEGQEAFREYQNKVRADMEKARQDELKRREKAKKDKAVKDRQKEIEKKAAKLKEKKAAETSEETSGEDSTETGVRSPKTVEINGKNYEVSPDGVITDTETGREIGPNTKLHQTILDTLNEVPSEESSIEGSDELQSEIDKINERRREELEQAEKAWSENVDERGFPREALPPILKEINDRYNAEIEEAKKRSSAQQSTQSNIDAQIAEIERGRQEESKPIKEEIEKVQKEIDILEKDTQGSEIDSKEIEDVKKEISNLRSEDGTIPNDKISLFNTLTKKLQFLQRSFDKQVSFLIDSFSQINNLSERDIKLLKRLIETTDISFEEIVQRLEKRNNTTYKRPVELSYFKDSSSRVDSLSETQESRDNFTNEKSKQAAKELGIDLDKVYYANELDDFVQKHGSKQTKFIWNLIKYIATQLRVPTKFLLEGKGNNIAKGHQGEYSNGQVANRASILIRPDEAARIIVHELVHGVTSYIIDAVKNNQTELLKLLTPKQINAAKKLSNLLRELQTDPNTKDFYGSKNEHEILAELTHDGFVEALQNKKLNFVEKFLDYILDILGIPTNAYDEALSILKDMIETPVDYITKGFVQEGVYYSKEENSKLQELKNRLKELRRQLDEINDRYDAKYVDAVKKGDITKEQAMQALEEAGRKDSSAYAEIAALESQRLGEQETTTSVLDKIERLIENFGNNAKKKFQRVKLVDKKAVEQDKKRVDEKNKRQRNLVKELEQMTDEEFANLPQAERNRFGIGVNSKQTRQSLISQYSSDEAPFELFNQRKRLATEISNVLESIESFRDRNIDKNTWNIAKEKEYRELVNQIKKLLELEGIKIVDVNIGDSFSNTHFTKDSEGNLVGLFDVLDINGNKKDADTITEINKLPFIEIDTGQLLVSGEVIVSEDFSWMDAEAKKLQEIKAKYDAELASLEQQEGTDTSDLTPDEAVIADMLEYERNKAEIDLQLQDGNVNNGSADFDAEQVQQVFDPDDMRTIGNTIISLNIEYIETPSRPGRTIKDRFDDEGNLIINENFDSRLQDPNQFNTGTEVEVIIPSYQQMMDAGMRSDYTMNDYNADIADPQKLPIAFIDGSGKIIGYLPLTSNVAKRVAPKYVKEEVAKNIKTRELIFNNQDKLITFKITSKSPGVPMYSKRPKPIYEGLGDGTGLANGVRLGISKQGSLMVGQGTPFKGKIKLPLDLTLEEYLENGVVYSVTPTADGQSYHALPLKVNKISPDSANTVVHMLKLFLANPKISNHKSLIDNRNAVSHEVDFSNYKSFMEAVENIMYINNTNEKFRFDIDLKNRVLRTGIGKHQKYNLNDLLTKQSEVDRLVEDLGNRFYAVKLNNFGNNIPVFTVENGQLTVESTNYYDYLNNNNMLTTNLQNETIEGTNRRYFTAQSVITISKPLFRDRRPEPATAVEVAPEVTKTPSNEVREGVITKSTDFGNIYYVKDTNGDLIKISEEEAKRPVTPVEKSESLQKNITEETAPIEETKPAKKVFKNPFGAKVPTKRDLGNDIVEDFSTISSNSLEQVAINLMNKCR